MSEEVTDIHQDSLDAITLIVERDTSKRQPIFNLCSSSVIATGIVAGDHNHLHQH
jgi:hypothetical protein